MTLLQKGPKYNINPKKDNWIQNLVLEAETAISNPPSDRDVYRKLTVDRMNTLIMNNSQTKHNTHQETRTIKSIQTKPKNNDAMIARADKGNSLVILPTKQYNSKTSYEPTTSKPNQTNKETKKKPTTKTKK